MVPMPATLKATFGDVDAPTVRAKLEQEKAFWDAPMVRADAYAWLYQCEEARTLIIIATAGRAADAAERAARWAMWSAVVASAVGLLAAWGSQH